MYLSERVTSEMMRYAHINNSEKLYFDLNSTAKPNTASGKIVMRVMISTIFSALAGFKRRFSKMKIICPPSSDKTGRLLNNPTDRFASANGRKFSSPNKYNR